MSGFSSEWLALREPADAAARSMAAARFAIADLDRQPPTGEQPPTINTLDLGCGSGSNVRYLRRTLSNRLAFRVVDNDAALLAVATRELGDAVDVRHADLRLLDAAWFDAVDFVTASALLDLVSEVWLVRLANLCSRRARAVLFALNYDGRLEATPHDPDDEWVRDLVNLHQRSDKGFGPALGPSSGHRCAAAFEQAGYVVRVESSDWHLQDDKRELQRQLIQGWADAAAEIEPPSASRVRLWQQRRLDYVAAGRSALLVGHLDVAGRR